MNLEKLADYFENPANNMRARVAFRLMRRGWSDADIAQLFGITKPLAIRLRHMHANRRNDWRDRVEGAKR